MYSAGELQARLALPSSIIKVSDNQITVFVSKSYDFDNEEDARFAEDDQDKRFDNLARMLMQTMVDQDTEDFHP